MSIKSLLAESIADVMQKVFHITTRLDHNTKTEKTHNARVLGEVYDFGCNPASGGIIAQGLDRGRDYPPSKES